ncbi:MAG TPA: BON domain-containing protein [Pyrinomonadaceae bacterium]|nr:BON domain-containing protein [Pyrinomonadaceae bacterium]
MCARIRRLLFIAVVALVFFVQAPSIVSGQVNPRIVREVRHELVTLPYYGVFDWLEFEVQNNGATVVLKGQVVRPTTKSDAERRVKDIEGVSNVVNEIETLPLSPSDDRLRIALYRQIYGWNSPLFRYAHQAVPSIHLIVNRGHATLKGIVSNRGDANIANIRARSVPGLFSVKNELKVESEEPR